MSFKVGGLLINDSHLTTDLSDFVLKRHGNSLAAIVMQSCASNNGSLSKDAQYLNALSIRNFKCQIDSPYFTPIYKVKTGSIKKNVKLLFPL